MSKVTLFLLLVCIHFFCAEAMVDGYQSGGSFASGLLSSVQDASKNTALGDVPGYVTGNCTP